MAGMEWQESLRARAYRETRAALHSGVFLFGDLVISAGVGAALAAIGGDLWVRVVAAMAGGAITFVFLIGLWFVANIPIAFAKQRHEARQALSQQKQAGLQQLIRVTPNQVSSMKPSQGTTVSEIDAYLDVATIDQGRPLRNCRVKFLELEHYLAWTESGVVKERWDRDPFYTGQTHFFSWSGRPDAVEAVDVPRSERACISKCINTRPEWTTTAGAVGHMFHGDQYHLTVEVTADNSLPLTKEYWLQMYQGSRLVIEEWDDSRTTWR